MAMTKRTTSLEKSLLGSLVLLAACLTLLAPGQRATGKSAPQETPQVVNSTTGFQVESLTLRDGEYVLSLRNTYDKSINGYTLGTGRGGKLTVELTTANRVIAPGGVEEARLSASNVRPTQGPNPQRRIIVLAVVFEDGTGDGDPGVVEEIKGRRDGAKVQFKRVHSLVKALLDSPEANDPAALGKLKARINSLSEEREGGQHASAKSGLYNAKQDALMLLQSLEQGGGSPQENLSKLKERIEKRISHL